MKYSIILFCALSLQFTYAEEKVFDTSNLTFSEALSKLQKHVDFTYSLPRIYREEGAKGSVRYTYTDEQKLLRSVIHNYIEIHNLLYKPEGGEQKHYEFKRSSFVQHKVNLLEARGSIDRYQKQNKIHLDGFTLTKAEMKFESTSDYSGYYWHIVYSLDSYRDGGEGTHHFFVYDDLLVEHLADGNITHRIPRQSTKNIIDSASKPSY